MQYVRSLGGSVSKTWNSINPATLSGAIDVIVVEQKDGSLACSPFHVRFGKFSLLRPYEKRVEFFVNGIRQNYAMKLGEGGEAFFVFETSDQIPESLQTSPVISPSASPHGQAQDATPLPALQEPDFLDISTIGGGAATQQNPFLTRPSFSADHRPRSDYYIPDVQLSKATQAEADASNIYRRSVSPSEDDHTIPTSSWATTPTLFAGALKRSASEELFSRAGVTSGTEVTVMKPSQPEKKTSHPKITRENITSTRIDRSNSPPPISTTEAIDRARSLSEKLSNSNIPTRITDSGDLMLDMTGYKSSEDQALRAEAIARKILAEELEGNYDIGALIGADEHGNLWIYSSEEAKFAARRRIGLQSLDPGPLSHHAIPSDAASDPGYRDDDEPDEVKPTYNARHQRARSDGSPETPIVTPHGLSAEFLSSGDPNRNYAKTLRLTSEQLKALGLKPGANAMSFSVNRATCQASMYYWTYDIPIVISDIDGTITKSDALGHVLNMIGRDWTHIGVAKLYTDIVANGYNILYLTSRSVGQADTTRAYLYGVLQEGFKLPKGPVIMSPDRTIAALRREIYLRKPEVFKMACLRDILNLFGHKHSPFYAGFGNRLTDALSYRSVNIPSTRIFTINSNAEVSLDLLTLNKYKNSYVTMRELVDYFFPPVGLLVTGGGDDFTDFNYWRDSPRDVEDFSESDCNSAVDDQKRRGRASIRSEDEGSEGLDYDDQLDPLGESYISRDSIDDRDHSTEPVLASIEGSGLLHENRLHGDDLGQQPSAAVRLDVSNLSVTDPKLPNRKKAPNYPLDHDSLVGLE